MSEVPIHSTLSSRNTGYGTSRDEARIEKILQSHDPRLLYHRRCLQCGACTPHCPAVLDDPTGTYLPRKVIALLQSNGYSLDDKASLLLEIDRCVQCYSCERICQRGTSVGAIVNILQRRNENFGNFLRKSGMLPGIAFLPLYLNNPQRMSNFLVKVLLHSNHVPSAAIQEMRHILDSGSRIILHPIPKVHVPKEKDAGTIFKISSCCGFNFPGVGYSEEFLLNTLGVDLITSRDQTCCGGAPYYLGGLTLGERIGIGARNLCVAAEECGTADITLTSLCPTCYDITRDNLRYLEQKENLASVNAILSVIGKSLDLSQSHYRVTHISDLLCARVEQLKGLTAGGLEGLAVKVHGSCHKKKWDGVEGTVNPLKELLRTTGARVIDSSLESDCCGGVKDLFSKYLNNIRDSPSILTRAHMEDVRKSRIDVLVTDCPGCMLTLDQYHIPVLHITQALSLAMGADPKKVVRVQDHQTSLKVPLEKIGVL